MPTKDLTIIRNFISRKYSEQRTAQPEEKERALADEIVSKKVSQAVEESFEELFSH